MTTLVYACHSAGHRHHEHGRMLDLIALPLFSTARSRSCLPTHAACCCCLKQHAHPAESQAANPDTCMLQSSVVYGGSALLSGVTAITPHLAGAVDIMVVQQPDGRLLSTPFYGKNHKQRCRG